MIVGFRDRETERIWRGTFSGALPHDIQSTALRKLNNARVLQAEPRSGMRPRPGAA
jgi:hypothetical protein